MIQAPTHSFYTLRANGEAAELITSVFSPGVTSDITDVIVLSSDFSNDIEPVKELDSSIEILKSGLAGTELIENVSFNPLYVPASDEELSEALELEPKTESVKFVAMDGNPFVLKSTEVLATEGHEHLISGMVAYNQFDLPPYEVIMQNQGKTLLN